MKKVWYEMTINGGQSWTSIDERGVRRQVKDWDKTMRRMASEALASGKAEGDIPWPDHTSVADAMLEDMLAGHPVSLDEHDQWMMRLRVVPDPEAAS